MRRLYSAVLYFLVPLVFLRLVLSGFRNPEYWKRWQERFGHTPPLDDERPVIWIHAVSVGEVHATKPLVSRLQRDYPEYQILITTMTPTGAVSVRQNYNNSVCHRYLPYDLPGSVGRFLETIKPRLLIVMETELWPNLFYCCRKNRVPAILVNGRMSEISRKGYARFSRLARETLSNLSLILAQTRADADRFVSLGASESIVSVIGNLKFDIRLPHSITEQAEALRRQLSVNRPVWIAASTHEGEEKIILNAFGKVLESQPHCLLIIAPRHPERFNTVIEIAEKAGYETRRKSRGIDCPPQVRVFVLDSLGELPVFYAASDIAFIGGSLVRNGGHNMLEPASLGLAVLTGPHIYNFMEISELLEECGAACKIHTADELARQVTRFLVDANLRHSIGEKGRKMVADNRGSSERLMTFLQPFLEKDATSRRKII